MGRDIQGFRLSPQQTRVWSLMRSGGVYGSRLLLRLDRELSGDKLQESLDAIVRRHDILRTTYPRLPGMVMPVQTVHDRLEPGWREVDLRDRSVEEGRRKLEGLCAAEGKQPYDLSTESPLRATLVTLAGEERFLNVVLPALCGDERAAGNLAAELARGVADNASAEQPGVSYLQYSEFQNALLEGEQGEEYRASWAKKDLASIPPLRLPFAASTRSRGFFQPLRSARGVDPGLLADLDAVARAEGCPLSAVLMACWQTVLWRLSGQDELIVAQMAHGRTYDIFRDALGLFARWVPIDGHFHAGAPFDEILHGLAVTVEEAQEAAEGFLWGDKVEDSEAAVAFPDVGFTFVEQSADPNAGALKVANGEVFFERCDLTLACVHGGDSLETELLYEPSHYRAEDVDRTLSYFHRMLAAVAADPKRSVDRLALLGSSERRRLVHINTDTERAYGEWAGFHRWFEEQVERTPERPAVMFEADRLSFRELNERANRLARYLRGLGVEVETPVVLCLDRSVELVVALLAVLKAGGVYVPITPSQPARRLGYMLDDVAAPVVLTQEHWRSGLPAGDSRVVALDQPDPEITAQDSGNLEVEVKPSNRAYVIFTSGSTGRPKGVMVEHRQVVNYTSAVIERLDLPAGGGYAVLSTFAADLGNTIVFPSLCTGGCLHVVSEERAADPQALGDYFRRHEIDCMKIVPSHLEALRESPRLADILPRRRMVFGGEALSLATAREVREAVPECRVFNHYGPSETTVGVTTWHVGEEAPDERCRTVPLGRPLGNVRTYLLDRNLEPVPPFVSGELYLGGSNVARGYLRRPLLTAERFVPDPFSGIPGVRLYRSGDQVRHFPGGLLEFLGRVDNQVKFHGFRVELDELRVALNRHPDVRDSVVTIKQDKQERAVLVAYYISRLHLEVAELRKLLGEVILDETLPNVFVHLRKFPLTLNGKINYSALPDIEEAQRSSRSFVAPRSQAEELMVQIWAEVLGVEKISVKDNFFELGGHSLLATQLVSRVRQTFQIDLVLRVLFESVSLEEFTAAVEEQLTSETAAARPAIEPVARGGEFPLSFAQERLWFMDQVNPGHVYNIHGAFRARGPLSHEALEGALRQIVERHESLRTSFASVDGQPVQVIAETIDFEVPVKDLGEVAENLREAEAERLAAEEVLHTFDLSRAPFLRVVLFRLAEDDHVISFTLHHIVADGWSLGILVRELMAGYAHRRIDGLGALPIQYADFAAWQREWLQAENLEAQLSYWEQRLRGAPELGLATDRPRPPQPASAGRNHHHQLPASLAKAVQQLSREHRVTPFMSLLAAFDLFLSRQTGQDDVVVGTDVANRNHFETEGLIGFFVNNLVLRTDLSGDPTFIGLLGRVREMTLGAYANQDMPFERLVKALRPKREPGQTPLFQVLFVVQNAPQASFSLPNLELSPILLDGGTAKFDLALFVREWQGGLLASWNYRTDLFNESTIVGWSQHFENLLESICAHPEARLSSFEMLSESERKAQAVIKKEKRSAKLKKLRNIRRRNVDLDQVELVKTGHLGAGATMPLVIEPAMTGVDLVDWAASSKELIDAALAAHGALLFRGFGSDSIAGFEDFARTMTEDLYGDYGDLPREDGGEKIYRSTPYPSDKMILFHNESSHLSRWPRRQFFCCVTAAQSGGETPIVDCRQAYQTLDPAIRERLESKRVMYVRNFTDGLDVSWQHFFKTEDRAAVEEECRQLGMDFEWKPNGLRTRQVCDAVVRHPNTGEKVFFNQMELFHVSCLDPEVRESMLMVFDGQDLPRALYYGDGSEIEEEVISAVSETYRQLAVSFPWQEQDILMVDNMLVSHARNPFVGPRKIVVAMGNMMSRSELEA